MTTNKIHYFDRSRVEEEWDCGYKRYLGYEFLGGKGLTSAKVPYDLKFGLLFAEVMEKLALATREGKSIDISTLAKEAGATIIPYASAAQISDDPQDAGTLLMGLILAFYYHQWPLIMRDFEVVEVELEVEYEVTPGIVFMARPDMILRRKSDGSLWYFEYKTTGWVDSKWINSWMKAVQVHAGAFAASKTLGEEITGTIVQGAYKGYKKYGRINSPLTYAYMKPGSPGILPDSYSIKWVKGYERFSTSYYPQGIEGWVKMLSPEVLAEQFPQTPPIFTDEKLVEAFFRQRLTREKEIIKLHEVGDYSVEAVDRVFDQKFHTCEPAFGFACPFNQVCWQGWIGADPLGSKLFIEREPHHKPEKEQYAA